MAASEMLAKLKEAVTALKVVKVYNQQDYEKNIFQAINNRLLRQQLKMSKADAATSPALEVLGILAGSGALIVGAHWVTQGKIDSPEFLALLLLLGAAADAVRKSSDLWNRIQ